MDLLSNILDLIDKYPNQFSFVLIIGYILGAICNWLFMKITQTITDQKPKRN